jgi:hypothetical protein
MADEKKILGGYGGIIFGILGFVGLGFLGYWLYRRSQFRFNDVSNSQWANGTYDWMKGQTIPTEFQAGGRYGARQILQLNSFGLFKKGDKVTVSYADTRAGGGGEFEVLHVINSKAIIIDQAPSPSGGPWSGTVQLA